MRLMFLALVGCVACDSGRPRVLVAPPPAASASPEAVGAAPAAPPSANPPPVPTLPRPPSAPRFEGPPDCRFQRLEAWGGGQVTWLGACQKGFAEGSGVIVNTVEGAEPERFYGQLDGGIPSIGVLQTDSGFMAGRWNHGAVAPALSDDVAQRNVTIEAFRAASSAATAVSKSFAKKADAKASSFYAKQARLLREQMD